LEPLVSPQALWMKHVLEPALRPVQPALALEQPFQVLRLHWL
jgi:hypothetical protein